MEKVIYISIPHDHDILKGRGRKIGNHPGNKYLRSLVEVAGYDYVSSEKHERSVFARLIMTKVRTLNPPGRFLDFDNERKQWYEITNDDARHKVLQAFRDISPKIRKKLEKNGSKVSRPVAMDVLQSNERQNDVFARMSALFGDVQVKDSKLCCNDRNKSTHKNDSLNLEPIPMKDMDSSNRKFGGGFFSSSDTVTGWTRDYTHEPSSASSTGVSDDDFNMPPDMGIFTHSREHSQAAERTNSCDNTSIISTSGHSSVTGLRDSSSSSGLRDSNSSHGLPPLPQNSVSSTLQLSHFLHSRNSSAAYNETNAQQYSSLAASNDLSRGDFSFRRASEHSLGPIITNEQTFELDEYIDNSFQAALSNSVNPNSMASSFQQYSANLASLDDEKSQSSASDAAGDS